MYQKKLLSALYGCILYGFLCSASNTPQYFQQFATPGPSAVGRWIKNHADLLMYLARTPYPLATWPEKFENGVWHLHKHNIKNIGYNNYIFTIPSSDYWVKISGPKHRVRNLYTYNTGKNSYWYTEIARHWELRNATLLNNFERVPTYQTISRFALYLLLQEAIKEYECQHVKVTPTYLVHIPGTDTTICDEHYVIVQKHSNNLTCLRDAPDRILNIPNQAIKELFCLIRDTGYWNIKNGLYVDQDNNLMLLDYEQRNIENPEFFFHKDLDAFEQCVLHGIQELATIHLKPHATPEKYELLLWLIATDRALQLSSLWPNYINLLG